MELVVEYNQAEIPLHVAVVSALANQPIKFVVGQESLLKVDPLVKGDHSILRYLARKNPHSTLYGTNNISTSQVDEWLDYALNNQIVQNSLEQLAVPAQRLNEHLQFRTFLADYFVTIADIAVWGHLRNNSNFSRFVDTQHKKYPHFTRWLTYLNSLPEFRGSRQFFEGAVAEEGAGKGGSFSSLELPNCKMGEVVTRFPPEPSGYLHIGHAKAALLNNYYATFYKGKLIIRFDDTNPAKEKDEFVEAIMEDLQTLKIQPSGPITYTSDYFEKLLGYAEQLIKDGLGYVDDTPLLQMRDERGTGTESKRRNDSVEENLKRWNEMKLGSPEGMKCVLRAKIDMQSLNGVMRDPSLCRCLDLPHQRTGTKFKVYPLYDFACPIVDSIEGVTHALRSNEYHDRNPLYYWVLDATKLRKPFIQDFSRLNFACTLMSKRKLQAIVSEGLVSGWDDPRFPTIRGLTRRGLTIEALRDFVYSQGASKNINLMEIENLWAINKQMIDPIVPRFTAIAAQGRVPLHLKDGPTQPEGRTVAKHKKNPSLGNKVVSFFNLIFLEKEDAIAIDQGEEVTLMDWGNAVIDVIVKENNQVVRLEGHLNLGGSVKTTKKKLTWLADVQDVVPVTLVQYGHLLTKKKLEENEKWQDFFNYQSKSVTETIGDANLRSVSKGERLQLERRGYFICDEAFVHKGKPIVLIEIPDGKGTENQSQSLPTKPANTTTKQ